MRPKLCVENPTSMLTKDVAVYVGSSPEVAFYRLSSVVVKGQVNLYSYTKGQVNLVSIERDALGVYSYKSVNYKLILCQTGEYTK